MSGFGFNSPASTGPSSGSLFGTASNNNTGGGAPAFGGFGTNNAAGTGASGFSFGGTPAAAPSGEPKSLFGQPAAGAPAKSIFGDTNKQTANIFGTQPGSTPFGQKPAANNGAEPPKSPFSGFGNTAPPATPASSAAPTSSLPSLFGTTTPAATTAPQFSFGNPSTTPAGLPSQPAPFGASTGAGGVFGNAQNQGTQEAPKQAPFSFGKPATAASAAPSSATTQAAPTANPFGGAMSSSSGPLFGAKPADKPAVPSSAGSLFGAKPVESTPAAPAVDSSKPKFSFGGPSANTTSAANTSSLFGTANATSTTSTTAASQPATSLFGNMAAPSQPSGSLFGSGAASTSSTTSNLFEKPSNTSSSSTASKPAFAFPSSSQATTTSSSTSSTAAPAPKSLFGGMGGNSTAAATSLFGATPAASTPTAATAPLFNAAPSSTSATTGTTTASAPSGSLFPSGGMFASGSTTSSAGTQAAATSTALTPAPTSGSTANTGGALGSSALGASTSGPAPPAQSRLKNKTMDEILTRWATDLTRYTKDFKKHAETIAQWDQIIVDNSSKIDKLYIKTRTCEKQTMSVEMQLAAVENQQNELESWLSKYENDVEEMLAKDGANQTELGGPDQDRERTYKLAEKLGEQLDDMGHNLESMVEEVNAANASLSKHTKADEPITQIVRILNSHLTQLQTIDQGTAALQAKVTIAQKSASGMGYLSNGVNGDGRAAVDDFYRSYMGRR